MRKTAAVYCIRNLVTNERYIGSSKNTERRWQSHICRCNWKKYPNRPLYRDMQKYGLEKFRFTLVAIVEEEHLREVEQSAINMLHPEYNTNRAKISKEEKDEQLRNAAIKYFNTEKGKKAIDTHRQKMKKKCLFEGEIYSLATVGRKLKEMGIEHPFKEAGKYLIQENEEK